MGEGEGWRFRDVTNGETIDGVGISAKRSNEGTKKETRLSSDSSAARNSSGQESAPVTQHGPCNETHAVSFPFVPFFRHPNSFLFVLFEERGLRPSERTRDWRCLPRAFEH